MVERPAHTPYDGSSKPFTVGLKPLDLSRWLEVNEHRDAYLHEKRRLYAEMPDQVFVAEEGTQNAQQEVLELVGGYLREHFPGLVADVSSSPTVEHSFPPLTPSNTPCMLGLQRFVRRLLRSRADGHPPGIARAGPSAPWLEPGMSLVRPSSRWS